MSENWKRDWDFKMILVATVVCSLMYLIQRMYASAWGAQAGFMVGLMGYWAQVPQWTDNSWDWYRFDNSDTADEHGSHSKAA